MAKDWQTIGEQLHEAIYSRNAVVVEKLLVHNPLSVNLPLRDGGFTPLNHAAGLLDNLNVIRILLRQGANVNDTDNATGQTPLHGAAENCDVETIRLLLKAGAKQTTDRNGEFPAELAFWSAGDSYQAQQRKEACLEMLKLPRSFDLRATTRPDRKSYTQVQQDYLRTREDVPWSPRPVTRQPAKVEAKPVLQDLRARLQRRPAAVATGIQRIPAR